MVKPKFLGRHLMVKGEYVNAILSGAKKATIRLGKVIPKYKEMIVHGGGRPIAKIKITRVTYKKVKDLTDSDAIIDGFKSRDELIAALRKAYGEVKDDDIVTIIEFEVEQRLDHIEPEEPYLGLEPADVARLALRYLAKELSDEEKRILLELTRSNSIRAVALKLYGSIERRYKVRRALRRALRMLVERGIIGQTSAKRHKTLK